MDSGGRFLDLSRNVNLVKKRRCSRPKKTIAFCSVLTPQAMRPEMIAAAHVE